MQPSIEGKTDKEIVSDNELIAAFISLKRYEAGKDYNLPQWYTKAKNKKLAKFIGYPHQLKYHEEWKWLMPVVEMLQEPVVEDGKIIRSGCDITIFYKACQLKFMPDEDFEDIDEDFETHQQGDTKLEATYKAVVEFIKWYNSLAEKQ